MEISVDRFKAAQGVAPWDKKKYAKWSEEDKTASSQTDGPSDTSLLGGIDSLFPRSASSDTISSTQRDNEVLKERKKSITSTDTISSTQRDNEVLKERQKSITSSDTISSKQRDNEVLKERKKSITRELCEIGDKDSTPTLFGQLKGK